MINDLGISDEKFQEYLKQIEIRLGTETRTKVEDLHQKGHLGEDICIMLSGQTLARPIDFGNLGEQIGQNEQKIRRM